MTTNNNNLRMGIVAGEGFLQHQDVPCNNTTAAVKSGDLVYMDSGIAKPLDSDAHAATLIGVALGPSAASSNIDNGSVPNPTSLNVGYGALCDFNTVSETLNDGDPVYYGGDAQTVTKNSSSGSHAVGCVRLLNGQSSISGGTNVKVKVLVYSLTYVTFKK